MVQTHNLRSFPTLLVVFLFDFTELSKLIGYHFVIESQKFESSLQSITNSKLTKNSILHNVSKSDKKCAYLFLFSFYFPPFH